MILFLTSSPCVPNADRAILNPVNGFVDRLRAVLPPYAHCLFVCSDPDSFQLTDRFGQDMADAFEEAGMPFGEFAVLDHRNAEYAAEMIAESHMLILAGGHPPTQNRFFQEIGLKELLEDFPGIVLGISAGTMNAAIEVYAQPEQPGEGIAPEYEKFYPGLGLTHVQVLPHYQQVKDDVLDGLRLFEDIAYPDSMGRVFYALVDGSFLYRDHEEYALLGEAYRIRDGVLEQVTRVGQRLELSE